MIFVTVGHQMPFDRLIRAVDAWAATQQQYPVFAQIGESDYRPRHISWTKWLATSEYNARLESCSGVVAHAGTGTIIQALACAKPLLVVPRLSRFGETRNDHQIGTAAHFLQKGQVLAAFDDSRMAELLDQLPSFRPRLEPNSGASPELLLRIRRFIRHDPGPEDPMPA